MVDNNYAAMGNHPYPTQQGIKLKFTSSGPGDPESPFGKSPISKLLFPGMNAVFSMEKDDDPHETFAVTGFYDRTGARSNVFNLPVPEEIKKSGSEEDAIDYATSKLRIIGVMEPNTDTTKTDAQPNLRAVAYGATDTLVHEECKVGDEMVWRIPRKKEIRHTATQGSRLSRRNPGAPRIVPLNKDRIIGDAGIITSKVLKRIKNKQDLSKATLRKEGTSPIVKDIVKRMKADPKQWCNDSRSKQQQVVRVISLLSTVQRLGVAQEDLAAAAGDQKREEKFSSHVVDEIKQLVSIACDFERDARIRRVGKVIHPAPAGGAAHIALNF